MAEPTSIRVGRFPAVHAAKKIEPDPIDEIQASQSYRESYTSDELQDMFSRCSVGTSKKATTERRVILRALCAKFGDGIQIGCGVSIRHPETFSIGDGVFIGDHAVLHGQRDGRFAIGKGCWLGPQSYFDARDLSLGDFVGWAPGAKALGSQHTGVPIDVAVVHTDLDIKSVVVGQGADIGVGAIILPGITIGEGAIIGAGSVVTKDVPPRVKALGIPARVVNERTNKDG